MEKRDARGVYYYAFYSDNTKAKPYPIESNVKINKSKYNFMDMKIGDSFPYPKEKHNSVRVSASIFKRRNPQFKFKSQYKKDDDTGRIWRVE
jgi:hypothetical protein